MKHLNQASVRVFAALIDGLQIGQSRKIDNAKGYMPVSVERIGPNAYSVSHYFEQNGDLVPDPDMEFAVLSDGDFLLVSPVSIQYSDGLYQRALEFDDTGRLVGTRPHALAEQCRFATTWLRNIKIQQGIKPLRNVKTL